MNRRRRSLLLAALTLLAAWLIAAGGSAWFKSRRITADKVVAYLHATDLNTLSGGTRQKAIRSLADQMVALPFEERRKARLDDGWQRWFEAMSDGEKADFIEATLPSGFKQMLSSFEQLPEEKRRKAIDDALKDLQKARDDLDADSETPLRIGPRRRPELSDDLQQKVVKLGLKSYYSEASAQTKAELAPLLEELQRAMESGRLFRRHAHN